MRQLVANWVRSARDLLQWGRNPFLVLELHRSRRRDWVPVLLGLELLVLGLAFGGCAGASMLSGSLGASQAWGGSMGSAVAIVLSLLHLGAAPLAAGLRGGDWVTREANSGTLELLLATPMTPVQMVLRRAAYPFLCGMLASLLPLPFYVFAHALGGPGVLTLASFYFIVTVLVISVSGISRVGGASLGSAQSRWGTGSLTTALVLISLFFMLAPQLMMLLRMAGMGLNPLAVPLVVADWLRRAQAFYAWPLPPLLVGIALFPVWLGGVSLRWAGRLDFEGRLSVPAARVRSALLVLLVFVALGYAWPGLVGGLRAAVLVGGTGTGAALRGLFLGLLLAAVLLAGVDLARGRTPDLGLLGMLGRTPAEGAAPWRLLRFSLLNTVSVLAAPVGVVLVGSLLSWTSPAAMGLDFAGQALASAGAMLLYLLGVSVFAWGAFAGRGPWQAVFTVSWYALTFALPLVALLKPHVAWDLTPAAIMSPLGGVLDLCAPVRWLAHWPWAPVAFIHAALGALGVAGGWAAYQYRYSRYERRLARLRREAEEAARRPRYVVPLKIVMEEEALKVQDYFDNPIMVQEVRRGFRRHQWQTLAVVCGAVGALILWLLIRAALHGASMRTGLPGLSFTQGLSNWQGLCALWPIIALGLPLLLAFGLPLGPAGSALSRRRREGTMPFVVMTGMRPAEIINGVAAASLYPVALCLLPVLAAGVVSSVVSLAPTAVSATLAMGACVAGVGVLMTGLTLLGAALSDFGPSAEGVGAGLAVTVGVIAELVKFALVLGLAGRSGVATDALAHVGLWVGAVADVGVGLLGIRLATMKLGRVVRRDIPIEGTVG